jgi:DNA/RNA endonuclease YhcR with UshA esterase domain
MAGILPAIGLAQVIPIYDIQYTTSPTGTSPYLNQTVTVTGVVTGTLSNGTFYMQDAPGAWNGIYIYKYSSVSIAAVSIGDSVQATGPVSEYNGKTEITITSSSNFQLLKNNCTVPAPAVIQTGDLPNTGSASECYESVLVETGVAVVTATGLSGNEWEINDGSGPCRIDDFLASSSTIGYTPVLGDTLQMVRGVVECYNAFKIEPRVKGDVLSIMPRLTSTIPSDGAVKAPAISNVRLNFSKQMDPSTMTQDHFSIIGSIDSLIPFSISYDSLQWVCFLMPSKNFTLKDTIHVWVSHAIADLDGRTLDGNSDGTAQNDSTEDVIFSFSIIDSTINISEIQKPGLDGFGSQMEGETVTVAGLVSGPASVFSNFSSTSQTGSWYLQDATGGVNIFGGIKTDKRITLGQMVVITGTVTEYNGVTEISVLDTTRIKYWGYNINPPSIKDMIYNQLLGESIEGMLVSVEGTISSIPAYAGGGYNMEIRNGNAPIAVRIGEISGFDLTPLTFGVRVKITGIVSQYDKEAPYNSGYQLVPRYANAYYYNGIQYPPDIEVLTDSIAASASAEIVSIKPNPFSREMGEVGVIEINVPAADHLTLRIYDLKGRLVKTCLNNVPGGHQYYYWDGTDDSNRRASIGMYIAHLRSVTDEGAITDKTKIVVLGTKLK